MTNLKLLPYAWRRLGVLLTLSIGLAGVDPAAASVIYDFSLASNGSVGAIDIQLTYDNFVETGLNVGLLTFPQVTSFSSDTPVNPGASVDVLVVNSGSTLFGLQLLAPDSSSVLYTPALPADFFAFARTASQTGTFTATGNVTSSLGLDTAQPTGTLVVTDTSVPEPATASLLGLGFLGVAGWQMRRKAWMRERLIACRNRICRETGSYPTTWDPARTRGASAPCAAEPRRAQGSQPAVHNAAESLRVSCAKAAASHV